jgi:hypothetical protein
VGTLFGDSGKQANATLINKCLSRIGEQRIIEIKTLPYSVV